MPAALAVIVILIVFCILLLLLPTVLEIGMRFQDTSFRFQLSLILWGRKRWHVFPHLKRKAEADAPRASKRTAERIGSVRRFLRYSADRGRLLLSLLKKLGRHICIRNFSVSGTYGFNDPAWTGWIAGLLAVAGVAAGSGVLDRMRPDFRENSTDVAVTAEVRVRPMSIVFVSVPYLVRFLQLHFRREKRRRHDGN